MTHWNKVVTLHMYSLFTIYRLPMNVYENYNHLYTWKVKIELWTHKHLFTVQTVTYANLQKSTVQQQQQSIRANLHIRHFATILHILDQQYILHKCNEKINIYERCSYKQESQGHKNSVWSHYSVKCSSFIALKYNYFSMPSHSTFIHLSILALV